MNYIVLGSFVGLAGCVAVALFVYLTLAVQPRLFPREVLGRGTVTVPAGRPGSSHLSFGLLLAAVFCFGVALMALGSAMVATTLGYAHG